MIRTRRNSRESKRIDAIMLALYANGGAPAVREQMEAEGLTAISNASLWVRAARLGIRRAAHGQPRTPVAPVQAAPELNTDRLLAQRDALLAAIDMVVHQRPGWLAACVRVHERILSES